MQKLTIIITISLISFSSFGKTDQNDKLKYRKLTPDYFRKNLSINDTSKAIIDVFFDKKNTSATGQMSFLPITLGLAVIPFTSLIGIGTSLISAPLFVNGTIIMVKYRNKKLYKTLTEYKKTNTLPNWIRKKAIKRLEFYEYLKTESHLD